MVVWFHGVTTSFASRHWCLNKMAVILLRIFSKCILIKVSLKFVPENWWSNIIGSWDNGLVLSVPLVWNSIGHIGLCHMTSAQDSELTHWGRVTHLYVSKLTIIGSDNGLSPGRRQATIWTNGGILLIGPLGTNFREILIEIQSFSFKKTHLKMSSGKWRPFCLGLNVLTHYGLMIPYVINKLGQYWFR